MKKGLPATAEGKAVSSAYNRNRNYSSSRPDQRYSDAHRNYDRTSQAPRSLPPNGRRRFQTGRSLQERAVK